MLAINLNTGRCVFKKGLNREERYLAIRNLFKNSNLLISRFVFPDFFFDADLEIADEFYFKPEHNCEA